jgi:hypothetical protein
MVALKLTHSYYIQRTATNNLIALITFCQQLLPAATKFCAGRFFHNLGSNVFVATASLLPLSD